MPRHARASGSTGSTSVDPVPAAVGHPGRPTATRSTAVSWSTFHVETGHDLAPDLDAVVRLRVAEGRCGCGTTAARRPHPRAPIRSAASCGSAPSTRRPIGGATATPRRWSPSSARARDDGATPACCSPSSPNPTSNAIYRRIGYRSVGEVLAYRFDAVVGRDCWRPRPESNQRILFRREVLYPLSYEGEAGILARPIPHPNAIRGHGPTGSSV